MKTIESDGMFACNVPDNLDPEKLKQVEAFLVKINELFTIKPKKDEKRKRATRSKKSN